MLAAVCLLVSHSAAAAWLTQPPVTVSGRCSGTLQLNMELGGFNNYGAGDGRADILTSGESGTWTFEDPCSRTKKVHLGLAISLDDHYAIPVGNYEVEVVVNGSVVKAGYANELQLRHGTPFGKRFTNWQYVWVPLAPANRYQITVHNRSGLPQAEWIAVDKILVQLSE